MVDPNGRSEVQMKINYEVFTRKLTILSLTKADRKTAVKCWKCRRMDPELGRLPATESFRKVEEERRRKEKGGTRNECLTRWKGFLRWKCKGGVGMKRRLDKHVQRNRKIRR
jgi:hypothetical protein